MIDMEGSSPLEEVPSLASGPGLYEWASKHCSSVASASVPALASLNRIGKLMKPSVPKVAFGHPYFLTAIETAPETTSVT